MVAVNHSEHGLELANIRLKEYGKIPSLHFACTFSSQDDERDEETDSSRIYSEIIERSVTSRYGYAPAPSAPTLEININQVIHLFFFNLKGLFCRSFMMFSLPKQTAKSQGPRVIKERTNFKGSDRTFPVFLRCDSLFEKLQKLNVGFIVFIHLFKLLYLMVQRNQAIAIRTFCCIALYYTYADRVVYFISGNGEALRLKNASIGGT